MNARPEPRWAADASASVDDSPYRSRLRAVWVPHRSVSSIRRAPAHDVASDLVEVTAPFTWAA